jgi:hypothetical protein
MMLSQKPGDAISVLLRTEAMVLLRTHAVQRQN